MAPITEGGQPGAQLLGPLAVEPPLKGLGIGKALAAEAIAAAKSAGENLIVLVGDMPYYQRFGFSIAPPGRFDLGGPVNPARLLMLKLGPGPADDYSGLIRADYTRAS